jgi:hypothetical protein
MAFYRGGITVRGSADSPDFLYYNADIVNNNQKDQVNGVALLDPQVRFNETRDKPILDNIADYHFSIIRFSMNGANLDLPLFCPQVALTPTSYFTQPATLWAVGTSYAVGALVSSNGSYYQCRQANTAVLANAPPTTAYWLALQSLPSYPKWETTVVYATGAKVIDSTTGLLYRALAPNSATQPANNPFTWVQIIPSGAVYDPTNGSIPTVYSFTLSYQQQWNLAAGGTVTITANTPEVFLQWIPQINNIGVAPPPQPGPIYTQNLNTRWWWATDYSYVVNLMNTTLISAWIQLYGAFQTAWANSVPTAGTTDPFPYTTFAAFCNGLGVPPRFVWNADNTQTRTITMYADSDCFGQRLTPFVNAGVAGSPASTPYCRLFLNNNMYGLLSGFPSLYWNASTVPVPITVQAVPGTPTWNAPSLTNLTGATNEMFFTNAFYTNITDMRLSPFAGTPPLGYVPSSANPPGNLINYQKVYWALQQDFACVDTMWSPIANLVFTSQLIPVVKEVQSVPNILGNGNLGNSAPVVPSAFQPIITDLELDLAGRGADAYRGFVLYEPQAEYRLSDFAASGELRSIDIQLWWKGRLDGQLYPVNMYNLSSVNLKLMFRKKHAEGKLARA